MATSAVQIEANRSNAQLSTGPQSIKGKLASSKNAVTCGLTSSEIYVRAEERADFDRFESNLLDELHPVGQIQFQHFHLILHAAWNIRRCFYLERVIQSESIATGHLDAILDINLSPKIDRVYRYRRMHESTHRRATIELRQLQNEQVSRRERELLLEESVLVETGKIVTELQRSNALKSKTNLDNLRAQIEAFTAPPVLSAGKTDQNETKPFSSHPTLVRSARPA